MPTLTKKFIAPVKMEDLSYQIHFSLLGKNFVAREVHGHCPKGTKGLTLPRGVDEVFFTASTACTLEFFDNAGMADSDFFGVSSVDLLPLPSSVKLTVQVEHGRVHFRPAGFNLGKHSVKIINNSGDDMFTGDPDPIIKPTYD